MFKGIRNRKTIIKLWALMIAQKLKENWLLHMWEAKEIERDLELKWKSLKELFEYVLFESGMIDELKKTHTIYIFCSFKSFKRISSLFKKKLMRSIKRQNAYLFLSSIISVVIQTKISKCSNNVIIYSHQLHFKLTLFALQWKIWYVHWIILTNFFFLLFDQNILLLTNKITNNFFFVLITTFASINLCNS